MRRIISSIMFMLVFPMFLQAHSFYSISGTILDTRNVPMPNVQVMLLGNESIISTYTNSNGVYTFTNILAGMSYTAIPSQYEVTPILDQSVIPGSTIVTIAQNELGNTDGPSPGRYYGYGRGWCSEFVSWVYHQAGDPFIGGVNDGGESTEDWIMSTVGRLIAGFGRNEKWQVLSIEEINLHWQEGVNTPLEPKAGDYVFYSNTSGIDRSHSGVIKNISGSTMHTIEGNIYDSVQGIKAVQVKTRANWRTYQIGDYIVKGIGYRRIVSNITFIPQFSYYRTLSGNVTTNFLSTRQKMKTREK